MGYGKIYSTSILIAASHLTGAPVMKILGFVIGLFILAYVLPRLLIPDGTAGKNSEFAANAYTYGSIFVYKRPFNHLIVTKLRLGKVLNEPGSCSPLENKPTTDSVATLIVHGYFGIPISRLKASCDGGYIAVVE